MSRLKKVIFFIIIGMISINLFEVSKLYLQRELVRKILNPYQAYNDPYKLINLSNVENTSALKQTIINAADQTGVSLIFTIPEGNKFKYYWYIKEDKYLFPGYSLNESIDINTFNSLEEPITEKRTSKFNFVMPIDTYEYEIYPFIKFKPQNIHGQFAIFSTKESGVNSFLEILNKNGISFGELPVLNLNESFINTLSYILDSSMIIPLLFGIYILYIISHLYSERRNLAIELVNGVSKFQYFIKQLLEIICYLLSVSLLVFISKYFIDYKANFKNMIPLMNIYLLEIIAVILISAIVVFLTVNTFTDVRVDTYIKGYSKSNKINLLLNISKVIIISLICVFSFKTIEDLKRTYYVYSTIKERSERYKNTYYINSDGFYLTTLLEKNNEIIKTLENHKASILITSIYEILDDIDAPAQFKSFKANKTYIEKYIKQDINGNKIDSSRKDVIYTQNRNIPAVKGLISGSSFYTETVGLNPTIITLTDELEIPIYYKDPLNLKKDLRNDFVVIPSRENQLFLEYVFEFEKNGDMEGIKKDLARILDVDQIEFKKITDNWQNNLKLYKNTTIKGFIKIISNALIIILISLLCYQTSFDKVKREFSIYWINGVDKFSYFLGMTFTYILESILLVLILKNFISHNENVLNILLILGFIIFIDLMSLLIFRIKFLKEINASLKEHI